MIPLFPDSAFEDDRPLPQIVADKWKFELAWINRNDTGEMIYSARDWFIGLGGDKSGWSQSQKSDWFKLLNQSKVEVKRERRKPEQIIFVDEVGLYTIAQHINNGKTRPQLKAIRDFLAKAGVLADTIRRDPDAAQQIADESMTRHNRIRAQGKAKRNQLTETAQTTHVTHTPNYAALTNAEYQELFGAAKDELVRVLELTTTQAAKFRDYLSDLALSTLDMAETGASIRMKQLGRLLTTTEQITVVRESARLIAPSAKAMANYLQVDLLSGRPLLESKTS